MYQISRPYSDEHMLVMRLTVVIRFGSPITL